ncbi:MAG: hypothetical protein ACK56I_23665, partial [bacterium]
MAEIVADLLPAREEVAGDLYRGEGRDVEGVVGARGGEAVGAGGAHVGQAQAAEARRVRLHHAQRRVAGGVGAVEALVEVVGVEEAGAAVGAGVGPVLLEALDNLAVDQPLVDGG